MDECEFIDLIIEADSDGCVASFESASKAFGILEIKPYQQIHVMSGHAIKAEAGNERRFKESIIVRNNSKYFIVWKIKFPDGHVVYLYSRLVIGEHIADITEESYIDNSIEDMMYDEFQCKKYDRIGWSPD